MKKLSLLDVKQALWDERFRTLFPEYKKEITDFLGNSNCACNVELFRKLMGHKDKMTQYFPTKVIVTPKEEIDDLSKNDWKVINCNIKDLEKELKSISNGRKQVAIARWQDQVTVLINQLDTDAKNNWRVMNCNVNDIEKKLKLLGPGKKQIVMGRWQDQVTIVVDELEFVF